MRRGATEGAKEWTGWRRPTVGANGLKGGATGKPGGAGKGSEEATEVAEGEGTGKVGAREESWGRKEAKQEEWKPGGADTEGKEDGKRATEGVKGATGEWPERKEHEGGREEPKLDPRNIQTPPPAMMQGAGTRRNEGWRPRRSHEASQKRDRQTTYKEGK